jgi:hypothetical protein
MALRLLLVGVVVGLGVDLPGGAEVASWARTQADWVQAKVDGWLASGEADAAETSADAEFAAIVDGMADDFAADLARAEPAAPGPVVAASAPDLPGAGAPGPDSTGAGDMPEVPAADPDPAGGRLASAVRLTREAAAAWFSLVR